MASSSSPITSVPDPSQSSALASVITQVQPRQGMGARPVRPKKVTKPQPTNGTTDPSRDKKKKKKKKKKTQSVVDTATTATTTTTAATSQQQPSSTTVTPPSDVDADADVDVDDHADRTLHSHPPSSTLVGGGESNADTIPITQSASPPPAIDRKQASSNHVPPRSLPDTTKTSTAKPLTPQPTSEKPTRSAAAIKPVNKKPPSIVQKLVAFLTCSSATADMVKQEHAKTSSSSPLSEKTSSANDVVVPARSSNTKAGSQNDEPSGRDKKIAKQQPAAVVPPPGSSPASNETKSRTSSSIDGNKEHHKHLDQDGDGVGVGDDEEEEEEDDDEDDEDDDDEMDLEQDYLDDDQTEEQRLIMQGGMGIPVDELGNPQPLLQPIFKQDQGLKCLVLDLDETLVHSSFKMIPNADFIVPVEIEGTVHNVYVIKRPGVDDFMRRMGEIYEVVVFTASLSKYADPVLDMLDIHHAVHHRLFRESCYNHKGNYVKDLSQLGRPIADTIIIDNSPASYIFHPNNAVPVSSWFNDPHDTELTDLCPFLADLTEVDDVRAVLDGRL